MHFWFLYSLVLCQLLYVCLRKLRTPIVVITAIAAMWHYSELAGPNWGPYYQTRNYFVWYALGAFVANYDLGVFSNMNRKVAISTALAGWLAVMLGVRIQPMPLLLADVLGLAGIVGTLALAVFIHHYTFAIFLKAWGRSSMPIYLVHTVGTAIARVVLVKLGIEQTFLHVAVGTVAGIAFPLLLVYAQRRWKIRFLFEFE